MTEQNEEEEEEDIQPTPVMRALQGLGFTIMVSIGFSVIGALCVTRGMDWLWAFPLWLVMAATMQRLLDRGYEPEPEDGRNFYECAVDDERWTKISFAALRAANITRLPHFRNAEGEPFHNPDGSDWSDADWLEAVVGELGEYANLKKKVRRGDIAFEDAQRDLAAELADVVIYLDILASRLHINLGTAVAAKFNTVSRRIGVDVYITNDGEIIVAEDVLPELGSDYEEVEDDDETEA